jgi:CubicO group peptidase (beta-lactamase class C family)
MYNPWSDNTGLYYTDNLRKRVLDIEVKELPGLRFEYQSKNTMLLALVIERATGMSIRRYLEEKIWTQIGMEAPATWNTDRADSLGMEKAFCCLNARTMDFARFGRLLLHRGNWNGRQIIPETFILNATTPSFSDGGKLTYGYNMGIGPKKYHSFSPSGYSVKSSIYTLNVISSS